MVSKPTTTHMKTKTEPFRIPLPLDPNSWHGSSSEGIWVFMVKPHGDKAIVEVGNVPFFSKAVSLGDKIVVAFKNGQVVFDGIAKRGGHSTYRIFFQNPDDDKKSDCKQIISALEKLGCSSEKTYTNGGRLYALDLPPDTDIDEVHAIIESARNRGLLFGEQGHVGHPLDGDEKPRHL